MEARVPSWRPLLQGYKSTRKNKTAKVGRGQGTKLEASATRLQKAQKHKTARLGANLVGGGQSSG